LNVFIQNFEQSFISAAGHDKTRSFND